MTETALTAEYPWYPGELDVWQSLPDISTAEWAERYRTVTLGQHKGQWDNAVTPYLVGIMNAADLPWVREIDICGPEQSGKTNACINIHLKNLVYRPGNVKYIMLPKQNLAQKIARDRLIPIYRACEPVAAKLSPNPDDTVAGRIAFRDGTVVYPIWGTSPSEISSFPSDFTHGDEIDKNEDLTGDESDSLKLLEKRTRTFRRSLNLKCSTPTLETGHIWKAVSGCSLQLYYPIVCPHCGHEQIPTEDQLTWPGQPGLGFPGSGVTPQQPDADPKTVAEQKLARYICEGCQRRLDDIDRDKGVRLALDIPGSWYGWRPSAEIRRQESWGLLISGFICPDISLSDIAAKIIAARAGDPSAEKERDNSYLGIPHRQVKSQRKEDEILRLIDPHLPRGIVPRDTSCILVFADTQQVGYYYEVIAYGYGRDLDTTIIDRGFVESRSALLAIGNRDWSDAEGRTYRAWEGFIDSGGGADPNHPKHSRTREVYDLCIDNPFWHPLKGRQRQSTPVSWTRLEFFPAADGKKVAIPGGLVLYTMDVTYYKNTLARKLRIPAGDPGGCRLHCGLTREEMAWDWRSVPGGAMGEGRHRWEDYAKQMCVEIQDDRGYWQNPKRAANHHWDIGVYRYAGADIVGVADLQRSEDQQEEPAEKRAATPKQQPKSRRW